MADKLIEFTIETWAQHGAASPKLRILDQDIELSQGLSQWSVQVPDSGQFLIDFYSKTETDTIVENGQIIADTEFRIENIWIDNIKTELWFKHQACYRPKYFAGFLTQFPAAEKEIFAPYQFNFPGTITWNWDGAFWDWYFVEKNKNEVINFLDKDPDRVWKFRGSLDTCDDLVLKIKDLLKL